MEEKQKNEIKKNSRERSREIKNITFGDIFYYPEKVQVVRDGKTKKVPNLPSLILNCLIENQKTKISRHEITAQVWGKRVCSEENFYKQIEALRKVLGDNERPWQYITNPSKNCFALEPTAKIHYVFTRHDFYKVMRKALFFLTLSGAVTAAAIKMQQVPFYQSANYESLTNLKGVVKRATTSPDGSIVVFTHKPQGELGWNLMAQRIGTEERQILVRGQNKNVYNTEPGFSPSGTRIAWVKTDYQTHCAVFIADFNPSSLSISNYKSVVDCSKRHYGRTPQWRDENTLLVSLPQNPYKPNRIIEVNLMTHEQFAVTSPTESKVGDYGLYFNNATNKLAYLRLSVGSQAGSELRIFDFSNNTDSLLKIYPHPLLAIAWVNADTLLAKGVEGFEVVDLDGQSFPVHSNKLEQESFPFSMGSNRIGVVRGHLQDNDISILDLASQTDDNSLSSIAHDYRVVIAKDTGAIAFLSLRDNKRRLFITKQSTPTRLTDFPINAKIFDMAISPNGELIAYVQGNQLNIINSAGNLLYQKNTTVAGLSFTDDNLNLVYGIQKDGIAKVKRLSIHNLEETFVTDGVMPKATRNGDIYYFNFSGQSSRPILHKITDQGEVTSLFEAPFPVMNMNSNAFDVIDDKLYYVTTQSKDSNAKVLVSKNLNTGELTNITLIGSNYFSINRKLTTVVMTKKGKVQNNLASFEIVN